MEAVSDTLTKQIETAINNYLGEYREASLDDVRVALLAVLSSINEAE